MHETTRTGNEIERPGDRETGTRTRGEDTGGPLGQVLADEPTTVETASLSASLLGVPEVPLPSVVYDHQLDGTRADERRPMALFDVENTAERPITWATANTSFVGTDGYTYSPAQLSVDPSALGPGCHTRRVEVGPGRRARVVALVEELPTGVGVDEVVQTVPMHAHVETTRLTFTV